MYEILYREKGKRIHIFETDNYQKVKYFINKFEIEGIDFTVSYRDENIIKIIAFSK